MKTAAILLLSVGIFLYACNSSNNIDDNQVIAEQFYKGLNNSDFSLIRPLIPDSLVIVEKENDFRLYYTGNDYKTWFQWDSVFQPEYKILEIKSSGDSVFVKLSKRCERIDYLHGKPLVYKEICRFTERGITEIIRTEYLNADWDLWQENAAALHQWVLENHPDKVDFMSVQDMKYAQKYSNLLKEFLHKITKD